MVEKRSNRFFDVCNPSPECIGSSLYAREPFYSLLFSNIYTKDGKTLVQYATGKTDTKFVIHDGVTEVGEYAFEGCANLTMVVIPDSVTEIVNYAFNSCENLGSVIIGKNVKIIGWGAFQLCDNLTNVYYAGLPEEWAQIDIDDGYNDSLLNANITYYYTYNN